MVIRIKRTLYTDGMSRNLEKQPICSSSSADFYTKFAGDNAGYFLAIGLMLLKFHRKICLDLVMY